jgi:hypothetical protein
MLVVDATTGTMKTIPWTVRSSASWQRIAPCVVAPAEGRPIPGTLRGLAIRDPWSVPAWWP